MAEVRRVRDHFSRQRSALRQAEERLRHAEEATIKNVVTGHPQRGQGLLVVEVTVRKAAGVSSCSGCVNINNACDACRPNLERALASAGVL